MAKRMTRWEAEMAEENGLTGRLAAEDLAAKRKAAKLPKCLELENSRLAGFEEGAEHATKNLIQKLAACIGYQHAVDVLLNELLATSYTSGFANAGGKLDDNGHPIHTVKQCHSAQK